MCCIVSRVVETTIRPIVFSFQSKRRGGGCTTPVGRQPKQPPRFVHTAAHRSNRRVVEPVRSSRRAHPLFPSRLSALSAKSVRSFRPSGLSSLPCPTVHLSCPIRRTGTPTRRESPDAGLIGPHRFDRAGDPRDERVPTQRGAKRAVATLKLRLTQCLSEQTDLFQ